MIEVICCLQVGIPWYIRGAGVGGLFEVDSTIISITLFGVQLCSLMHNITAVHVHTSNIVTIRFNENRHYLILDSISIQLY